MTGERATPLRQRTVEDMRIRGMGENAQTSHIRAIKDVAALLGRSPDAATPDDLRAYQLHITETGVIVSTFNVRIVALGFFFGMTCGRKPLSTICSSGPSPTSGPWSSAWRRCPTSRCRRQGRT